MKQELPKETFHSKRTIWTTLLVLYIVLSAATALPVAAQTAENWRVLIGGGTGCWISVAPGASDGWTYGNSPRHFDPNWVGIFSAHYREEGVDWNGPTGLFGAVSSAPIPPGGSKTWPDIYLWAQNYFPGPSDTVHIWSPAEPHSSSYSPPQGYVGHLVLDQVPEAYHGPMDYWLDLTQEHNLSLPIPVVTDPLQGTRMHLTVYAPVPEPSSLAALALGLVPLAAAGIRRRRA